MSGAKIGASAGPEASGETIIRRFFVPKDQIHYLRFLLEGYEGVLTMSSESGSYLVTWEIPAGMAAEAADLAGALAEEIQLRRADD